MGWGPKYRGWGKDGLRLYFSSSLCPAPLWQSMARFPFTCLPSHRLKLRSLWLLGGLPLWPPWASICRMVWLGAGVPESPMKPPPAGLVPEPGESAVPVEEQWPRLHKRCKEKGKLLTMKLQSWMRICRKRQRHLKRGWVRHSFNRRNNRGENQGGKRLGGKRKFYARVWGEQAMKKIDSEWKGSSLDKDDVVRKQRRELTCWNKKGKEERGAVHKTPNLSANERTAGLAKSSKAIFWQNHKTHTTPYHPAKKSGNIQGYGNYTNMLFFKVWANVFSKPVTWICREADFTQQGTIG